MGETERKIKVRSERRKKENTKSSEFLCVLSIGVVLKESGFVPSNWI